MKFATISRPVPLTNIEIFEKVKRVFSHLAEIEISRNGYEGNLSATSHVVCKAIERSMGITCREGFFNNKQKHYWLETDHGFIIDVLPIGIYGGPILVDPLIDESYKKKTLTDYSHREFEHCITLVGIEIDKFLKDHP